MNVKEIAEKAAAIQQNMEIVIKDKPEAIRFAIASLLCRGHLLVEDVPGVGKTVLGNSLALSLNCSFRRIQFTSDLLPSDILGVSIFNPNSREFEYRKGPIFSNIVLADEINRATPKTQSSLLEAMSEGQVSMENTTRKLLQPFMVIATQNPKEHYGTFPLPESQLDRFQLRISMGYPSGIEEMKIITGLRSSEKLASMMPVVSGEEITQMQNSIEQVEMEESLLQYLMGIIKATREHQKFDLGVSTRGSIAFYRTAQALAAIDGREFCLPDDIQKAAVPCLGHRVLLRSRRGDSAHNTAEANEVIGDLVNSLPVPR